MMTTKSKPIELVIACLLVALVVGVPWWYLKDKKQDWSKHPVYGKLVGKKYMLKEDTYIYKYGDSGKIYLHLTKDYNLKVEDIQEKELPLMYQGDYILKVIPKGMVFTITRIEFVKRTWADDRLWIKAKFDDHNKYGKEIDVSFLADYSKSKSEMDNQYVTEITPEGEPVNEK